MGVIRKIFFTVSVLFVCSLSAQTVSDTIVFDGDKFVKHIENLFAKKDRLILAISGGADSVVLALLLSENGFNFSFWDRLFNTYCHESVEKEKDLKLGLEEFSKLEKKGFIKLMLIPFFNKYN